MTGLVVAMRGVVVVSRRCLAGRDRVHRFFLAEEAHGVDVRKYGFEDVVSSDQRRDAGKDGSILDDQMELGGCQSRASSRFLCCWVSMMV